MTGRSDEILFQLFVTAMLAQLRIRDTSVRLLCFVFRFFFFDQDVRQIKDPVPQV